MAAATLPKRFVALAAAAALSAWLGGCATRQPMPESPIEQAQRRLKAEPPLVVAEGCVYYRNLLEPNRYLKAESRILAGDAARAVIAELKKEHGVTATRFTVPLMCASPLPPRAKDSAGRVAETGDTPGTAPYTSFPVAYHDVVGSDHLLRGAYVRLFAECDWRAYEKEKRYDCPLLSKDQAARLRVRLGTSYVFAVSVGGDRASLAHKSGTVALSLLLGFINVPGDQALARLRLVNLDTGALIWSSVPEEFNGAELGALDYRLGEGGKAGYEGLLVKKGWERELLEPLFDSQR